MNSETKENGQNEQSATKFSSKCDNSLSHSDTGFKVKSWGYRHQQSLILFFTLTVAYSMRACMGVALVAMTHHEDSDKSLNETEFKVQGVFNALMLAPPYPVFNWSKKIQDTVLSSFFWGYMTLQIPAGQLAHRFGAKYLLIGAMLINCIVPIFLPLGAYYGGWIFTVILRIVQGLSQACLFPSMHTIFGKWAPLEERGRLTAFAYGGQAFGTVLGLPITGFISSSPLGWPGIFRFYGLLSGIICVVLWFFAADTPAKHTKISYEERRYIEEGLGQTKHGKKPLPVPWSKILSSRGVYAIVIAHIGQTWGQVILYSEVPAFMDKIMKVNIKANGLLTALPFLVMWFTNFFFSWFTDMLIVKKILSVTATRKLANSIGAVIPAIGLIVLAFVPKNIYYVETVNPIDIAPNYAGTMMSLSNFTSNSIGSFAPIVAGFILTDVQDEYLWRKVFFVAAGLYFFTNLVYVILGTAEKADWNDPQDEEKQDLDEAATPMIEKQVSESVK